MNQAVYRLTGKEFCLIYKNYPDSIEEAERQLRLKLHNYEKISQHLLVKTSKDLVIYLLLHKNQRLDVKNPNFFDLNYKLKKGAINGIYEKISSFNLFCLRIKETEQGEEFSFAGTQSLIDEFRKTLNMKSVGIETPLQDLCEEECYKFLNLEQSSTNDTFSQIPSNGTSLSSETARKYQEKIALLERQLLERDMKAEELERNILLLKQEHLQKDVKIQTLERKFSIITQFMYGMSNKVRELELQNNFLKQKFQDSQTSN